MLNKTRNAGSIGYKGEVIIMSINLKIKNVKNIRYADLQIPFEKGIYAFVGENGCGKSTLMLALSLIVKKSSMGMFLKSEIYDDSYIKLNIELDFVFFCQLELFKDMVSNINKGCRCTVGSVDDVHRDDSLYTTWICR